MLAAQHPPVVQFASSSFIFREQSGAIAITAMRIGRCDARSVVPYATVGKTAKADVNYRSGRRASQSDGCRRHSRR